MPQPASAGEGAAAVRDCVPPTREHGLTARLLWDRELLQALCSPSAHRRCLPLLPLLPDPAGPVEAAPLADGRPLVPAGASWHGEQGVLVRVDTHRGRASRR
jgi:hypothetical protein